MCWTWSGLEVFVNGIPDRLAGNYLIVDTLPQGLTCQCAEKPVYPQGRLTPPTPRRPRKTVLQEYTAGYGLEPGFGVAPNGGETWNPYQTWRGEKTYHPWGEIQADKYRQWYHFDAEGKVLGRLAQVLAFHLRGKDSPLFDHTKDIGAFVVVTNCEKVRVSGKKFHYKLYIRNLTKKPGGLKFERFKDLQKRFPERIIMKAVWGAMPKTPSSRRIFKERLKLFTGPNHAFYDKDPIDYPMWRVKDCTHAQNIPKRDRIAPLVNGGWKREVERFELKDSRRKDYRLRRYKAFLRKHMRQDQDTDFSSLSVEDLRTVADEARLQQVLKDGEGKPNPPTKVKEFILGTRIVKKEIEGPSPWKSYTKIRYEPRGTPPTRSVPPPKSQWE